ncbi:hypothetical protein [Cyclobacterium xiamenense]
MNAIACRSNLYKQVVEGRVRDRSLFWQGRLFEEESLADRFG